VKKVGFLRPIRQFFFPVTLLETLLRKRIAAAPSGMMPFASLMEMALYHPEHGYYGSGPRRIGRGGDFFTSVSTGPLFGKLLAMLAHREWQRLGRPAEFALIEQGAHDGQLAEDILTALNIPGARYLLLEPNPRYREAQHRRLGDRVNWIESLAEAPAHAFYLSNELPDAFPVHLVRWNGQNWLELHVDAALTLVPAEPSSPALTTEIEKLPSDLDPGHTMEISLAMLEWVKTFSQASFRGSVFIADYGYDAEEFLTRPAGTLRRYRQHQTDDQILSDLGEADLTTSINFTRLISEAESQGLRVLDYDHQGRFLTRLATPWLATLEGCGLDVATLRQFHSLTHPAIMGRSFRCVLLDK
jgi:SAM-dependent MidA family methyltransferase